MGAKSVLGAMFDRRESGISGPIWMSAQLYQPSKGRAFGRPGAHCRHRGHSKFVVLLAFVLLAGCTGEPMFDQSSVDPISAPTRIKRAEKGGINLTSMIAGNEDTGGAKIGVNALLWRASLDTLSFMPLASADPFGGVIITDWYSDPATPKERFKASIYILDQRLRADALRVSLFRQVASGQRWKDAPVTDGAERKLEDQILTRARQMRIAGTEG